MPDGSAPILGARARAGVGVGGGDGEEEEDDSCPLRLALRLLFFDWFSIVGNVNEMRRM